MAQEIAANTQSELDGALRHQEVYVRTAHYDAAGSVRWNRPVW